MKFPEIKKPNFPKLSRKQIFSLLVFLFILVALPVAVFLVQQQQIYQEKAVGAEARPTNVKITNLHGGGFSVSWTSSDLGNDNSFTQTTGWLKYSPNQDNLDKTTYDDRGGENFSSTTHHVSIFNLNAETTYYFKIKSGPDLYGLNPAGERWVKGGTAKGQKTPKTLELSGNPRPIYGFIKDQGGNKISGALVYVRLKKDDSDTKSALMSTVTKSDEGWVVDIKNTRKQGLGAFFDFDGNDRVLIDVQAGQNGAASANFAISESSPSQDLILAIPTPTPTSLPTPSPTPTITGIPSPTPTLSWIKTGTYTVGCNSSTSVSYLSRRMKFQMVSGGGGDCTISLYCYGSTGANWSVGETKYDVTNQTCPLKCGEWRQTADFGALKTVTQQNFSVGCNDGEKMTVDVYRYGH